MIVIFPPGVAEFVRFTEMPVVSGGKREQGQREARAHKALGY